MKDLTTIHTQELSDISTSIAAHLREPENKTFSEMAVSSCGSLFTEKNDFSSRCEAFSFCGFTLDQIVKNINSELERRISL